MDPVLAGVLITLGLAVAAWRVRSWWGITKRAAGKNVSEGETSAEGSE